MQTQIKTKNDGKGFERFDDLLSKVVKVPKDEILRREAAEKKLKKGVKNAK